MLKKLLRSGNSHHLDVVINNNNNENNNDDQYSIQSQSERFSTMDTLASSTRSSYYMDDDQASVITMETFVARNYDSENKHTLSIYSTLFKSGLCVIEDNNSNNNAVHSSQSTGDDHPQIQSIVPTQFPFTKTKTPFMILNQRGDILHDGGEEEEEEEYCKIWQKILSNDQILYTIEFNDKNNENLTMLNTGSKGITEVMINGSKFTWYGTPGLGSTFGSGFFELLDNFNQPIALYYSIVGKTLAKTKKVGEFVVWDPNLASCIVAMGLALREQEQRKNFERNHILVSNAEKQ